LSTLHLLVTNDDGIFSEGIKVLAEALEGLGRITVVAPDRERSAAGHSLTLHRPLRIRQVREHWYCVDGTPSDCVNLAVHGLLKDERPDLVVSGINLGLNLGNDVTYSGTVSATFEANMHGLPGVAFSQELEEGFSFERSAELARRLLESVLAEDLPKDLILNVNFPARATGSVRWTHLGKRGYRQTVVEKLDPKGRKYYWIAGTPEWEREEGTDHEALLEGNISVTPLHLDLTDYHNLERSHLRQALEELPVRAEAGDA
jgi:5'-nucleotidase